MRLNSGELLSAARIKAFDLLTFSCNVNYRSVFGQKWHELYFVMLQWITDVYRESELFDENIRILEHFNLRAHECLEASMFMERQELAKEISEWIMRKN